MKGRIPDIWVAVIILLVVGVVFFVYGRGLLPSRETAEGGGGPKGGPTMPPHGSTAVEVRTLAGGPEAGYADGKGAAARFNGPAAVAVAPGGAALIADARNHRIRSVSPDGTVTTVAGSGPDGVILGGFADGPALSARFSSPAGVAVAGDGSVYIADSGNHRIRRLAGGMVTTVAGGATAVDRDGLPTGGFADGAGAAARFCFPAGLCMAGDGSLYVADSGNHAIRRVTSDGTTSTVVAGAPLVSPTGLCLQGDGSVLIADPGAGGVFVLRGRALSQLPATTPATAPAAVCVGADGALYLGCTHDHVIVRYAPPGPGQLWAGVLFATGVGATQDGDGSVAGFWSPSGLARAPSGAIIIADFGNNAVRVMTSR